MRSILNCNYGLQYGVSTIEELQSALIGDGYDKTKVKQFIKTMGDQHHDKEFNAILINPDGTSTHCGSVDYWQLCEDRIRDESNVHIMKSFHIKERLRNKLKTRKSG